MAAVPQYRRVWRDFLEAYMSMPCLWQVRCPDYGNREKRDECYYKLAEMCRQIEPMANKEFVLKKINCYRTTFRKELKKALDAQRKGSHYEPTLWYYRILLPVAEQQPTSPVVKVEKIEDHSAIHSAMFIFLIELCGKMR
ncbi:uncharacterized protein GBIM_13248 [Gryllus bimaculatus]|nr:uncharacterized protein GBIM_13248 [Gryllus bimaculatus]